MLKFTTHTQKKLVTLFEELGYTVRFEKGNFQSGYCLVEQQKIVIINKFYDIEGKINTLIDILSSIDIDSSLFSDSTTKFYTLVKQTSFSNE